ncbi:hypothetical protein [Anaerofustis sp.]|uniref:hypothetical protein n=1 Tax=Anaerofustis sp. TaxID=1872517 RepID=UPI0025C29668|nr:hypothetical protein [Anaerofustis sp.]
MKLIVAASMKDAKFVKFEETIQKNCGKDVEVVKCNVVTDDFEALIASENPDAIVKVGVKVPDTDIPVIDGLALNYPQMGAKKLFDAINKLK